MARFLRAIAREVLPPVVQRRLAAWSGQGLRFNRAASWTEAAARSTGYDEAAIRDRVVRATREVIAGRAAYERDGVTFPWPTLSLRFEIVAPLLRAALRHGGLDVIDFGGSLGSTYRQHRAFLPLPSLRWQVIEQAGFVAAGRAEFSTEELSFHATIDELAPSATPRVLLASSSLQYLEDPTRHLSAWAAHAGTIILDRTPFSDEDEHQPSVQHVPSSIYPASYPCWILSRRRVLAALGEAWRVVAELDAPEGPYRLPGGPSFAFSGLVLERS